MARCFWFMLTVSTFWAFGACSPAVVPAARRADGSWHLQCSGSLVECVQHASDLCKDRGYVVLGGKSEKQLYGAELGISQVEERKAELDIACADHRGLLPTVRSAEPASSPALPPPAPAPVSTVSSAPR